MTPPQMSKKLCWKRHHRISRNAGTKRSFAFVLLQKLKPNKINYIKIKNGNWAKSKRRREMCLKYKKAASDFVSLSWLVRLGRQTFFIRNAERNNITISLWHRSIRGEMKTGKITTPSTASHSCGTRQEKQPKSTKTKGHKFEYSHKIHMYYPFRDRNKMQIPS